MVRTCVTWDVLLVLLNPPQDLTSCRAGARPGHPISGLMHCSNRRQRLLRLTPNLLVSLVSLSWLKAFGTEHRSRNRSSEKLDKRFRRLPHFRGCANPSGPDCRAGEFPGKRAKHFRSRYRHDLRSLCDPDLGFALGNDLSSLGPGTRIVFDFNWSVIPRRSTTFEK